jgi:hypothetical protein
MDLLEKGGLRKRHNEVFPYLNSSRSWKGYSVSGGEMGGLNH